MDGGNFCVFDRSVLVSNGVLHGKVSLIFCFIDNLFTETLCVKVDATTFLMNSFDLQPFSHL